MVSRTFLGRFAVGGLAALVAAAVLSISSPGLVGGTEAAAASRRSSPAAPSTRPSQSR